MSMLNQFCNILLRYTLTVDITFEAPPNYVGSRKRREQDDQPGVIVVISFNGVSNVDVSAITLDLEIETAVTDAYTQMPDGFDGLIATSYPGKNVNYIYSFGSAQSLSLRLENRDKFIQTKRLCQIRSKLLMHWVVRDVGHVNPTQWKDRVPLSF